MSDYTIAIFGPVVGAVLGALIALAIGAHIDGRLDAPQDFQATCTRNGFAYVVLPAPELPLCLVRGQAIP